MSNKQAFVKVFGAAAATNARYGDKIRHPVTGELVYPSQVGGKRARATRLREAEEEAIATEAEQRKHTAFMQENYPDDK